MEKVRINPFAVFSAIWKDKPVIEMEGEQEEVIAKLAPREALELNKSLKRASNMAGKLSLEKAKNEFKKSNKVVEKGNSSKGIVKQPKEIEIDDEERTR